MQHYHSTAALFASGNGIRGKMLSFQVTVMFNAFLPGQSHLGSVFHLKDYNHACNKFLLVVSCDLVGMECHGLCLLLARIQNGNITLSDLQIPINFSLVVYLFN